MEIQRALADLYAVLDPNVMQAIGNRPITCKKGCSHCCSLYVVTSIADGINIAAYLAQWRDYRKWVPVLAEAARKMTAPGINKTTWWKQNIPCVFLKDNLCSVYDNRPVECRYYFVMSPVEFCGNSNSGIFHAAFDTIQAQEYVWKLSQALHAEHPNLLGPFGVGPLPLMVLHGLRALLSKLHRRRAMIEKALEGLPLIHEWTKRQFEEKRREANEEAGQDGGIPTGKIE